MSKAYVVKLENGAYRITDSRVSLDSVVYAFLKGDSPEAIAQSFPVLKLAEVYGALAWYLENQDEFDAYLSKADERHEQMKRNLIEKYPQLYRDLRQAA
ncbi:MAG: DUF433 domain-containing protein [Blastocatellia bacterium]|nr:DUF433 domain-containing protein [Blastocatellia bacterium]